MSEHADDTAVNHNIDLIRALAQALYALYQGAGDRRTVGTARGEIRTVRVEEADVLALTRAIHALEMEYDITVSPQEVAARREWVAWEGDNPRLWPHQRAERAEARVHALEARLAELVGDADDDG